MKNTATITKPINTLWGKTFDRWFRWLQKDTPTGDVVFYPELTQEGETSLKGVYIIGDLTGIPLLKFATTGGLKLVKGFPSYDHWKNRSKIFEQWEQEIKQNKHPNTQAYDVVIIGAGPAGISAGIEAKKRGYKYIILEASERPFNTIQNFPKEKPMFYEPKNMEEPSELKLKGDTKEELLDNFFHIMKKHTDLNIVYNEKAETIETLAEGEHTIKTKTHQYLARKTILAIGKSGNHRNLGVPGETLPHVYNQLFDPHAYTEKNILVIGGGDTALESAQLLQKAGATVTMSYRQPEFTRPKPGNIIACNKLQKEKKLTLLFNSTITEIRTTEVDIAINETKETRSFDNVFIMIGTQLPYEFFKSAGIKIANAKTHITYWWMTFAIAFANIVYFGKASAPLDTSNGISSAIASLITGTIKEASIKTIAWTSVLVLGITGIVITIDLIKKWKYYFKNKWSYIKYTYFFLTIIFYLIVFFGNKYFSFQLGNKDPYFWYSFLYTITIGLFGARRIATAKKTYVTIQTTTLFFVQAIPLFFIPNVVLPWMNTMGWIHPWIIEHVFLGGEWWRFVGFVLAWPLFFWNIFTNEPSIFWLIVSLIQTFIIIPLLVIKYGKGAYCSWICSCGAMAETLGDEYRTLAPHGPKAKKWENVGQILLLAIIITTTLHILGWVPHLQNTLSGINNILLNGYSFFVDTLLAGTLGVGLYFFYSGRMWCRFACPLAALMHIYNKFSTWGILADKKKCISCGLCTKECHMGIDVMGYAQQGRTVTDGECVNCSACVNVCPTGVLSFGKYKKLWGNKNNKLSS